MRRSETPLPAGGLAVVTADLSEPMGRAAAIARDDLAPARQPEGYGTIPAPVTEAWIGRQARWTLAVSRWTDEAGCDTGGAGRAPAVRGVRTGRPSRDPDGEPVRWPRLAVGRDYLLD